MQITRHWFLVALLFASPACGGELDASKPNSEGKFQLEQGDTVCLIGGALAERMQHDGWLETRMHERFPSSDLRFRNLGFSADAIDVHQRTANFGKFTADGMESSLPNDPYVPWDRYLDHVDATRIFAFFGYNESFAGPDGVPAFKTNLNHFIEHVGRQRYALDAPVELILFSSIPHEDLGDPNLPDGKAINVNIELYNAAMQEVAAAAGIRFVDLYAPMLMRYRSDSEPLTMNGIHLDARGHSVLVDIIDRALFQGQAVVGTGLAHANEVQAVNAAVIEKNKLWFSRYRATDGYNVYGNRSRLTYEGASDGKRYSNFEVLQREMDHLDGLVAAHDERIWSLAKGEGQPLDDSKVLPLIEVQTNKTGAGPAGSHVYTEAAKEVSELSAGPGMRVQVFADERQFPALVNPVQMAWDTRGRLWVATWPTYPHARPDQPTNDKLLILEDTDGDGRADTCKEFASDLHNPTGFEFWNGGVLLAAQPDLLFLVDHDGDDRADERRRLLHGLSSADTHHAANSFVIGPDGALYFQEGTFHQSQVESIYGPLRQRGACAWRFDPRTWRVERYIPYGFANPHGHVFDRWGQDFITDGTGNNNYYALGFSGHLPQPQNHAAYFTFFKQHTRPAGGTEILSSRHFPEEFQGDYLIANVIGFRGIHRYKIMDDGSGFGADELAPIVESSSLNFRPVDIEMGPDGALYFLDWHNALIGHMQHHLRDPSRDNEHGRVYRVTYAGRDLLTPPAIAGEPIEALLELLRSPEDRTRYRVRLELSGRASDQVISAAQVWVQGLDPSGEGFEHARLEALWLHQQHNRVDRELLLAVLRSPEARARAAATRVVRHSRHLLPDALELLLPQARDENARVRLEAVVAASFLHGAAATSLALEVLKQPMDKFLDYALGETMRALESDWKAALRAGEPLAQGNQAGIEYLLQKVDAAELGSLPHIPSVLMAILTRHGVEADARRQAAEELAQLHQSSIGVEYMAAMQLVDASSAGHADHVLYQLSDLLDELGPDAAGPTREDLLRQAEEAKHVSMRSLGYGALINRDGSVDAALTSAHKSGARLQALLGCVERIEEPALRTALAETVAGLLFEVPPELGESGPGTGLEVAFYEPRPRDASRGSFDALSPSRKLSASRFTLDIPAAQESDSFGLAFSGTLFAPTAGAYQFSTTSDDGTRLFINGKLVVNNDGDHGPVTKSGELELTAGAHSILVHYYEAGGGDELIVRWSGPGLEEQEIAASALGSGLSARLRQAAARAMGHVPGLEMRKVGWVRRLLAEGAQLESTLDLLASIDPNQAGVMGDLRIIDTDNNTWGLLVSDLLARLGEMTPAERTTASAARAIQLGHRLVEHMRPENVQAARAGLAALGGLSIVIRTLPHQMRYDITEFEVQAGMPVSIIFENNDMMPHNLVITLPGALQEVGQAAEKLSGKGASAQFIPASKSVLWHTGLVLPGQSERLTFVAPEQEGVHPYVCTYPGHWRVMNGSMRVVPAGTNLAALERSEDESSQVELRPFVKDWTLAELLPSLGEGWESGASAARGKPLFETAGCIKCHITEGQGALGGPELTAIREKYQGPDLLTHIIEPSKEVLDEYRVFVFELEGRADVIGRILKEEADELHVMPNLLEPEEVIVLPASKVRERFDTQLSPMPSGLLVTLSASEILDLLLFLQTPNKQ